MNYLKRYLLPAAAMTLLAACHSTKKITQTTPVTVSNDTARFSTSTEDKPKVVDSAALARDVWSDFIAHRPAFKTLSGKLGVSINSINLNQDFTANLRMTQDSLIWLSLTGPFGIEGARVKLSQDSAIVINKLNKTVERHNLSYLQRLLQQPVSYADIQNLLTGRPLLQDGTIASYQAHEDGTWTFVLQKGNAKNEVIIHPADFTVLKNTLQDLKQPSRTCMVVYKNFQSSAGNLPRDIAIDVAGRATMRLQLSYKQVNFNQLLEYPFNIPTGYSVR